MQFWTVTFAVCLTLAILGTNVVPQALTDVASADTAFNWSVSKPLTP